MFIEKNNMLHAISVDVEDWYQSTYDPTASLSDRFELSTYKILDAFDSKGVQGTFFVLGLAAKKAPSVVTEIVRRGHEVQSHGYSHRSNLELDQSTLRKDVCRAKKLLEDITGNEIYGYRAPCFTVTGHNEWVLDLLVETGHRYDSSIFPIKTSRYGISDYPPAPRIIHTGCGYRLVEAPVACFSWLGHRLPCGGGGYFRLLPYWVIRQAWQQLERLGRPGIVYMHPYEYDPLEASLYRSRISRLNFVHQDFGRRGFPGKIDRLLEEFAFGSMKQLLNPLLNMIS